MLEKTSQFVSAFFDYVDALDFSLIDENEELHYSVHTKMAFLSGSIVALVLLGMYIRDDINMRCKNKQKDKLERNTSLKDKLVKIREEFSQTQNTIKSPSLLESKKDKRIAKITRKKISSIIQEIDESIRKPSDERFLDTHNDKLEKDLNIFKEKLLTINSMHSEKTTSKEIKSAYTSKIVRPIEYKLNIISRPQKPLTIETSTTNLEKPHPKLKDEFYKPQKQPDISQKIESTKKSFQKILSEIYHIAIQDEKNKLLKPASLISIPILQEIKQTFLKLEKEEDVSKLSALQKNIYHKEMLLQEIQNRIFATLHTQTDLDEINNMLEECDHSKDMDEAYKIIQKTYKEETMKPSIITSNLSFFGGTISGSTTSSSSVKSSHSASAKPGI